MSENSLEPAAWYSPTTGYYVLMAYNPHPVYLQPGVNQMLRELPEDATRVQGEPTQWAYDQVCVALAKHRQRADDFEALIARVVAKIQPVIGGDWKLGPPPLDVAVGAVLHMLRMATPPEAPQMTTTTINPPMPGWTDNSVTIRHEVPPHVEPEHNPTCNTCGRAKWPEHVAAAPGLTVRHPFKSQFSGKPGERGGAAPDWQDATRGLSPKDFARFDRVGEHIRDMLEEGEQAYSINTEVRGRMLFTFEADGIEFELLLTATPKAADDDV